MTARSSDSRSPWIALPGGFSTCTLTAGSRGVSLLLLTTLITAMAAAIRWTARRARVLVVISGTAGLT